ncbi:hypothetical protein PUN28_020469 [Cardiocondyla obscurior]|uniref:Reverse transcriptase domain-containing protein n=1 Tax=Cardiocondyla obscurior TaxID=286306 RepID=A0AAW2E727_9HYME
MSGDKTRWTHEESVLMARREAQLTIEEQPRFMNQELQQYFPQRTIEAIKGKRKQQEYKTMVLNLIAEMTNQAEETLEEDEEENENDELGNKILDFLESFRTPRAEDFKEKKLHKIAMEARTAGKEVTTQKETLDIDPRQRAFRSTDGCADNTLLLDTLLRYHRKKYKSMYMASIDVSKAFDTVTHPAIKNTLETKTRIEGTTWTSKPIHPARGVRQGDPLSPILFNAITHRLLQNLPKEIGVELGETRINAAAFADDLLLFAKTPGGLQTLIDTTTKYLDSCGISNTWRYLGVTFSPEGRTNYNPTEATKPLLDSLTKAPLKPQQRIYALRTVVIPKLYYHLALGATRITTLNKTDKLIRTAVRKWLALPHDVPIAYFHATVKDGGLGIPATRWVAPLTRRGRLIAAIRNTQHQELKEYINKEIEECDRRLTDHGILYSNPDMVANRWAQRLYEKIDGIGCLAQETINHVLQQCHRTHEARIRRHDAITKYLARKIPKSGYQVFQEPKYQTTVGLRKPDLVAVLGETAVVIDAQVVSEQTLLTEAHRRKVRYYEDEAITKKIKETHGVRRIITTSATLSWKGVWSPESAEDLKRLGFIRANELKILATRTLIGGMMAFKIFNATTSMAGRMKRIRSLIDRFVSSPGAFLPKVLYAAAGWADLCTERDIRKLRAVQRRALISVTGAYRTASWESLCVVAGAFPIDLRLRVHRAVYDSKVNRDTKIGDLEIPASLQNADREIEAEALNMWQTRWSSSGKAKWLNIDHWSTQVLTGHGNFGERLASLNLAETEMCVCGKGVDSVEHFLLYCSLFDAQRVPLRDVVPVDKWKWPEAAAYFALSQEAFSVFAGSERVPGLVLMDRPPRGSPWTRFGAVSAVFSLREWVGIGCRLWQAAQVVTKLFISVIAHGRCWIFPSPGSGPVSIDGGCEVAYALVASVYTTSRPRCCLVGADCVWNASLAGPLRAFCAFWAALLFFPFYPLSSGRPISLSISPPFVCGRLRDRGCCTSFPGPALHNRRPPPPPHMHRGCEDFGDCFREEFNLGCDRVNILGRSMTQVSHYVGRKSSPVIFNRVDSQIADSASLASVIAKQVGPHVDLGKGRTSDTSILQNWDLRPYQGVWLKCCESRWTAAHLLDAKGFVIHRRDSGFAIHVPIHQGMES